MSISSPVNPSPVRSGPVQDAAAAAAGASLSISVSDSITDVEGLWRDLEATGTTTCYQKFDWVNAWWSKVGVRAGLEPLFVVGRRDGRPVLVWAFGIARSGGIRIAGWLSDTHSNYNLGVYAPGELARLSPDEVRAALRTVGAVRRVHAFVLKQQPTTWAGVANPLATALASRPSPSNGHACAVTGTFAALLAARNGGHKLKKQRQSERQFEALGGYRIGPARDLDDALSIFRTYLAQKAERFAALGIQNSFADPGIPAFYEALLHRSYGSDRTLIDLWSLSVGGAIRAVAGISDHGDHRSILFLSLSQDEMIRLSPGRALVHKLVEASIDGGMKTIDFGVGEEPYKESWCDHTVDLVESYLSVGPVGRLYVQAIETYTRLKRLIKQNAIAWDLYKRARRLRAGPANLSNKT